MAAEATGDEARAGGSLIGALVGQYRVIEEIGRGGMGVVYRAVHEEIGRVAAVKVLAPDRARDPVHARRFLNEARAVSLVEHPGMVKIFDFGEAPSGVPYILMEYLPGELLRARLDRLRSLPAAAALRFARQAAGALAAAHERGIVHRDLKPDNVMLVPDDEAPGGERVKLLDFGIARFADEAAQTTPGAVIGTAAYMAPEQCAGDDRLDGRADVYALGVVLYEMLAGAPPFRGDFASLLAMHLHREPPALAAARPDLPEVARLVHRMLAKEPTLRPDMAGVIDALRRLELTALEDAPPTIDEAARSAFAPTADLEPRALAGATTAGPGPIESATTVGTRDAPARVVAPPAPDRRRPRIAAPLGLALAAALAFGALLWARPRGRSAPEVTLTGMAWIPGATFRMGSTKEEIDAECARAGAACARAMLEREQPVREVTVSGFHLDVNETTNDELATWLDHLAPELDVREDRDEHWPRFVEERARGVLLADLYPTRGGVERTPDGHFRARPGLERKPAVQVTWDAASLYCQARGKRLPTEAEWELAARGVERRRFPWGEAPPRCEGVVVARDDGRCKALPARVEDVGSAPDDRTPEGVHDLGGNVQEWVEDAFLAPFYPDCGACRDPRVTSAEPRAEDLRIKRGGTWSADDTLARGATRGRWKRSGVLDGLGFRCASR
jgi:serine/threonine-protein kinase